MQHSATLVGKASAQKKHDEISEIDRSVSNSIIL